MTKGQIIIYTGKGKGKTTAALGTAMRALGQGMNVCMIQFIKSKNLKCGEHKLLASFKDRLELHILGQGFIYDKDNKQKQQEFFQNAWQLTKEKVTSGKYQLVILDELTHLVNLKLITEQEVLTLLSDKPPKLHIIITGRGAPNFLIKQADLVTEMREIKHPYKKGVKAIKGIDY